MPLDSGRLKSDDDGGFAQMGFTGFPPWLLMANFAALRRYRIRGVLKARFARYNRVLLQCSRARMNLGVILYHWVLLI